MKYDESAATETEAEAAAGAAGLPPVVFISMSKLFQEGQPSKEAAKQLRLRQEQLRLPEQAQLGSAWFGCCSQLRCCLPRPEAAAAEIRLAISPKKGVQKEQAQ